MGRITNSRLHPHLGLCATFDTQHARQRVLVPDLNLERCQRNVEGDQVPMILRSATCLLTPIASLVNGKAKSASVYLFTACRDRAS
jgi:hypothetical protein